MLADNGASSDGVNTYLVFCALFTLVMSVVFVDRTFFKLAGNRVGNHQRGAARSVNLLIVVSLYYFNVK